MIPVTDRLLQGRDLNCLVRNDATLLYFGAIRGILIEPIKLNRGACVYAYLICDVITNSIILLSSSKFQEFKNEEIVRIFCCFF